LLRARAGEARRGATGFAWANDTARGSDRRRRARSRRGRGNPRQAVRPERRGRAARNAAAAATIRRVPVSLRPAGLEPEAPREPLRFRLRLGALPPAGQAALGLVRAADRIRGPPCRPDRAAYRPGRRPRPGAQRLVGGPLRTGPRRRIRRRHARRAPRLSRLRWRQPPGVGATPRRGGTALPDP